MDHLLLLAVSNQLMCQICTFFDFWKRLCSSKWNVYTPVVRSVMHSIFIWAYSIIPTLINLCVNDVRVQSSHVPDSSSSQWLCVALLVSMVLYDNTVLWCPPSCPCPANTIIISCVSFANFYFHFTSLGTGLMLKWKHSTWIFIVLTKYYFYS